MCELVKDHLRAQDWHVPVRRWERNGKIRESWVTREVLNLVKKKNKENVRFRKMQSDRTLRNIKPVVKNSRRQSERAMNVNGQLDYRKAKAF